MRKKLIVSVVAALTAVALLVPASDAAAGTWLPIGAGKREIKSYLKDLQVGTQFASKVDTCYKPQGNRVRCFWQTREYAAFAGWYNCYGTAKATLSYGWVDVTLMPRNWVDKCFWTDYKEPFA